MELVGYNGEQQETVGRFMSLSVSKPTISICFICITLWSTGGDWCRLMLTYAGWCLCSLSYEYQLESTEPTTDQNDQNQIIKD